MTLLNKKFAEHVVGKLQEKKGIDRKGSDKFKIGDVVKDEGEQEYIIIGKEGTAEDVFLDIADTSGESLEDVRDDSRAGENVYKVRSFDGKGLLGDRARPLKRNFGYVFESELELVSNKSGEDTSKVELFGEWPPVYLLEKEEE